MKHLTQNAVLQLICQHQHPSTQNQFDEYKLLSVQKWETNQNVLLLKELSFNEEHPVLIEWQHNLLTSILDVTGCTPYEIWYFNQNKEFTGKAFSLGEATGNYIIQSQARYILLWNTAKANKTTQYLEGFKCVSMDWEGQGKYNFTEQNFGTYYGRFPYLIINHQSVCFTQIPIQVNPSDKSLPGLAVYTEDSDPVNFEKHLISVTKQYHINLNLKRESKYPLALVLSPDKVYYFEPDSSVTCTTEIPSGGILVDLKGKIIARNTEHYVIQNQDN
ncbi:hypothetical protein [Flavobacterium sp.]|uniref:hypothetical protein n=1 Tax=Flavobacterium sp. TaxID=239 RepID=UPI0025FA6549|nr:hypothetical protein [Flavobacterium sp.]